MRGLAADFGVSAGITIGYPWGGTDKVASRYQPVLCAQMETENMIQQYAYIGALSSPYEVDLWRRGGHVHFL